MSGGFWGAVLSLHRQLYRYIGSVYNSEVKIVGMVEGGDPNCVTHTYAEPWTSIRDQYNLTIMTH